MKKVFPLATVIALLIAGLLIALREGSETRPSLVRIQPVQKAQPAGAALLIDSIQEPATSRDAAPVSAEGQLVVASPDGISGVVMDATGAPLEGAVCEILENDALAAMAGVASRDSLARKSVASVKSGANGEFYIDVAEGLWDLRVVAQDHAPWEEPSLRAGDFRWVRLKAARKMTVLVKDTAGHPIADAEVRLLRAKYGDTGQAERRVQTDRMGIVILESLPTGTWFAYVTHRDYAYAIQKLPESENSITTLEIVLKRGIRIEGRVTVTGGDPAPQGTQVVFDTEDGSKSSHVVLCDTDGRYVSRIAFAPRLSLELAVLAPGYGESRRDVSTGVLSESGVHTEDFVLETLEHTAIGRVVDPEGEPLEGVEVYQQPLLTLLPATLVHIPTPEEAREFGKVNLADYDPLSSPLSRFQLACKTDAGGYFRVGSLHPQTSYGLMLVSPQYANRALWIDQAQAGETTDLGTTKLQPAGRVWGHVRRPDGSPVEGISVRVLGGRNWTVEAGTDIFVDRPKTVSAGIETVTGDSGFFSLQPFPEGEFRLIAKGVLIGPLTMPPGGELGGIEIVVKAKRVKIPVTLSVVDPQGLPVPRAYVSMTRVASASAEPDAPAPNWSWSWDVGDEAGLVKVSAPEEGTYEIEVKDMQGRLADVSFQVELEPQGLEQVIALPPSPLPAEQLRGIVLSATGEALEGMKVSLVPDTGATSCGCLKFTAETDELGEFTFGDFMPGDHRLTVVDPQERYPAGRYFPARPGQALIVTLK